MEERGDLSRARVLVTGLSPWGMIAAVDLASAGVGALHLADDGAVTADDLRAVRRLPAESLGRPRARALEEALSRLSPSSRVSRGDLVAHAGKPLAMDDRRWDLILCCAHGDDLLVVQAAARFAHAAKVPFLAGHLEGLEAIFGPVVIPGETACWECARLRRLANARDPSAEHALQASLLEERPRPRTPTYLSPTAGVLGHALAASALEVLTRGRSSHLVGRLVAQNLVTLRATVHSVLRLPWCDVCGGAAGEPAPPEGSGVDLDSARDPAELSRLLPGVVDERTGIVQRLTLESMSPATFPELPRTATAHVCAFTDGRRAPHRCSSDPDVGAGKGVTALDALVRAVGEAVERYSAERYETAERLRASVADMARAGRDFVPPDRLGLYSDEQYSDPDVPYVRLAPGTPIDWVAGVWLDSGSVVHVPALPTYFNYRAPREESFCQVSSNGLAAGPTLASARLRATLELVERDSFMITWLARLPAKRIELDDSVDPFTREAARQLEALGARVGLFLVDSGIGVPTVVSIGFGDGKRWPGATVGMSAHPSPRAAIRKAMLEQGHVGPYLRDRMLSGRLAVPETPDDVRGLIDHAAYYFPASRAAAFTFLEAGGSVSASDLPEPEGPQIDVVLSRLRAAGLRVACVDVTSADLAATPFRVARAVGPDFQQIHFGHRLAHLGNPRLLAKASRGINPDPHPMA